MNYTSTISTLPAASNKPASCALSTLKGKLPTKSLRSGEKFCGCSSSPSLDNSSSSSKPEETATRRNILEDSNSCLVDEEKSLGRGLMEEMDRIDGDEEGLDRVLEDDDDKRDRN